MPGRRSAGGRTQQGLRHSAGQDPGHARRPPDPVRSQAAGAWPPCRRRPVLPDLGRYPGAARGRHRSLGRQRGRGYRHEAHQGARWPHGGAGPGRGRAHQHAARGHRYRHGRLGAAGGRHAGQATPIFRAGEAAEAAARGRAAGAAEDGRPRRAGSRDGGRAGLPAQPHQPRFHLLQARHRGAAHRPAHAGQRGHQPAGLPRLPAHPPRRSRRAAAGPSDQRHQLLPRPRVLRGAGRAPGRTAQGPRAQRRGAGLGAGLRDRRGSLFTGDPAGREGAPAGRAADHPDLRHRSGPAGDPVGAGRDLSDHHRGRRLGGAVAALLRARAARVPRAPRGARDGAVRPARPVEGFAVLATRPGVLPQLADLPEPRSADAGLRYFPFRPGARRPVVPGFVRNNRRRGRAVHGAGQEEPHLRLPRRAARGAAGADGPRHAGARTRRPAEAFRARPSLRRMRSIPLQRPPA